MGITQDEVYIDGKEGKVKLLNKVHEIAVSEHNN
jgi:hypothetical protein